MIGVYIMTKRYKVLVICGGGIFGAIPAHFLSMLPPEEQTLSKIDLLAGCSIGGILAASYATGKSFTTVDNMFQKQAPDCFKKRLMAVFNPVACPTYQNSSIDNVLDELIGDNLMGDVRNIYPDLDLIIPSLNITDDSYKVFDNITGQDDHIKLSTIAGITSAAPSYFSGRELDGKCYVDGGMIEVAPLLTATTALKGKRGVPFEDMDVLMLGTGRDIDEKPLTVSRYNGLTLLGMATDVIVPYVTLSNEMSTRYWGEHIGYGHFEYFNPCTVNGAMDDTSQIKDLVEKANKYEELFLASWYKWLNK